MDETQQYQQKTGGGRVESSSNLGQKMTAKKKKGEGKTLPRPMEQPILSKTDGQTGEGGGVVQTSVVRSAPSSGHTVLSKPQGLTSSSSATSAFPGSFLLKEL